MPETVATCWSFGDRARKIRHDVRTAFGQHKARDLTDGAIKHYIAERVNKGHAPASINRSLQVLKQAVKPFLEEYSLRVPKMTHLPEDNVREGFFTKSDVEAIVAVLPEDLKDYFAWGYLTGWRRGEISSLKWADVDRAEGSLRLSWRHSKTKKARTRPSSVSLPRSSSAAGRPGRSRRRRGPSP